VLKALDMALRQRLAYGVIHHSDQGSQYTSLAFGQRCEQAAVSPEFADGGRALTCILRRRAASSTTIRSQD